MKAMDWTVLDDRSRYHDLTLFGIYVIVDDDVTKLYGVVESDSEEIKHDQELESYLIGTNSNVSPQSMAQTKQTARKTDKKGQLPSQSSSGQTLATFPNRRSPRFLDSDSDLERAANMFGVRGQSPARRSSTTGSPARGTKRPVTPSSSSSGSSRKSPRLSSPARGALPRGIPGQGTSRGAGRSVPVGTVNPQLKENKGRPGQAGARGASRSSPRFALPSFSTEEEDDDKGNEDDNDEGDDDEVDFPKQRNVQIRRQTVQRGKQPRQPVAAKNLNLIRAPRRGKSGFSEIAAWNRSARQGAWKETKRGWMAKHERQRDDRGRPLRRRRPGIGALYEIRFYQKSICFLVPMVAFQRLVRQVALDVALSEKGYRWQARALFALQQAAEAYMVAYLCDANLLAIHAKRSTIMKKDMELVRRMRGRRAVGFEMGDN